MCTSDLEFNVAYDDLSDEDVVFLSLKYEKCNYKIRKSCSKSCGITYNEPKTWPAFFVIDADGDISGGIFTDTRHINLIYWKINKTKRKK